MMFHTNNPFNRGYHIWGSSRGAGALLRLRGRCPGISTDIGVSDVKVVVIMVAYR